MSATFLSDALRGLGTRLPITLERGPWERNCCPRRDFGRDWGELLVGVKRVLRELLEDDRRVIRAVEVHIKPRQRGNR